MPDQPTFSPVCPACKARIPIEDVNMAEGVALCRACSHLSKLSELTRASELSNVNTSAVPKGCGVREDGDAQVIYASLRNSGNGAFFAMFALFWNGVVSIFVVFAIASTVQAITGIKPSWVPKSSHSGSGAPFGSVWFLWLFLTPFILIGLGTACMAIAQFIGRTEVRVRSTTAKTFTGFWFIGLRRTFDVGTVKDVYVGQTKWQQNGQSLPQIVIEADREVRIGSSLNDERRKWLAAVLRETLVPK